MAVTGWLPHTSRAALTGLRKKGHQQREGRGRHPLPDRRGRLTVAKLDDKLAALATMSPAQLPGEWLEIKASASATLRPGTQLVREWRGSTHRVMILDDAYLTGTSATAR